MTTKNNTNPAHITDEQVAELRRLMENATPGPWEVHKNEAGAWTVGHLISGNRPVAEIFYLTQEGQANAALIAAAVNALPGLLAERERLRAALEQARHYISNPGAAEVAAEIATNGEITAFDTVIGAIDDALN